MGWKEVQFFGLISSYSFLFSNCALANGLGQKLIACFIHLSLFRFSFGNGVETDETMLIYFF